jgi:hypothetical protein
MRCEDFEVIAYMSILKAYHVQDLELHYLKSSLRSSNAHSGAYTFNLLFHNAQFYVAAAMIQASHDSLIQGADEDVIEVSACLPTLTTAMSASSLRFQL